LVDGYWNECFRGTVVTVLEDSVGATGKEIDGGREERAWTELLTRGYDEARAVCDKAVGKSEFYAWQSEHGLKYGELFAIAQGVCWGEDQSVAEIQPAFSHLSSHHLVHPAILDAAFQVCSAAPSQGMTKSLPTCIPHKMQDVWITASGWQQDQQQARPLKVCTKSIQSGGLGLVSSLTVLSDQGLPLCHIKCLEMSPIATSDKSGAENSRRRKLLTSIEWKPSLSMLSPSQLREYCLKYIHGTPVTSPSQQDSSKLACSVRRVVRRCLPQLQATGWPDAPPHMKKYVSWLASRLQDTSTTSTESPNKNKGILSDLTALSPPLAAIATQLLFHINSPSSSHPLFSPSEPATSTVSPDLDLPYPPFPLELTTLLHLSAHQSPTQKILALNTGTDGGLAQHVLSVLGEIEQRTGGVAFTEFVYADADGSKTFLNMAQRRLAGMEVGERVRFVDFGDAAGLEEREFDMIFVGTRMVDRDGVLGRVRRLLKAGGKLVVFDTTGGDPELDFLEGFALGVLPDWWGGDEESGIAGRVKSDAALDRFLKDSGFSGVDLVVRGAGQQDGYRVAVSSATVDDTSSPGSADQRNALFVIDDQPSDYQQGLVSCMTGKAPFEHSSRITISQLASNDALSTMDVVFLGDIDRSLLAQLPESTFKSLQTLAQRSRNLLWVTSSPSPAESPYSGLKDGLLRTLRAEFTRSRIVSLSIQGHTSCESIQEAAGHISHVFNAAFGLAATPEVEYVVRDGLLHVGRLIQEPALDEELLLATTDPSSAPLKVTTEPWLPGPPLRLAVQSPGSLETLSYVDDTKYRSAPLGPNEVEVEAKAWGLNFRDVFIALGRLPGEIKEGLGGDCAGVVTRVGEGCEEFRPGDRVFLLTFGCMRMFPRADQRAVIKIPDALGFAEACAVMFPAVTAWQSLAKVARLEKGEKVLVHAAAGATGQMAVQIARYLGAEVFATVGYEHKKRLLLETYGDAVKEERVLYSRDTSFTKGVMRLTDGYGVDVVLNSLAGEGLRGSWECIAPYGRFIEIGKVDIQANSALHMAQFAKNVSFSAVDLRHVMASRPDMGKRLMREVMNLVGDGVLVAPSPVHTYPASAVVDAFRYFQSGRNTGRVVIELDRAHEVQVHTYPSPEYPVPVADSHGRNTSFLLVGRGVSTATPHTLLLAVWAASADPSSSGWRRKALDT
jgi:NADPH:quinone reductase-like Zn-dependent oxidoreductase